MSSVLSVVISVGNGPGLLPPLPGAHNGAENYAAWADTQRHQIIRFSDANGHRFLARDIEDAITPYVDRQSLTELFIYFAGHGECMGLEQDYWLLSKENSRVGDVINVEKTVDLSRQVGIPRLVIISDACRTIGDRQSLAPIAAAVPILPPRNIDAVTVEVDYFRAAGPGSASLEVQFRERAAKSYGVFTKVLLRALSGNSPQVLERNETGSKLVVRPGKLKLHLEEMVPREAASLPNGYAQRPDCRCESRMPLAVIGDVPLFTVGIATEYHDGEPVIKSRISLQVNRGPGQWEELGELDGPFAEFSAPSGLVYKSKAKADVMFTPERPMPLFELDSPVRGRFVADRTVPSPAGSLSRAAGGDWPEARIVVTRVMDALGRLFPEAPSAGVFRVVTYDPLTQHMATELQEFAVPSMKPKPVPVAKPYVALDAISAKAEQLSSAREFLNYRITTGLTLLGFNDVEPPLAATAPGLFDPPYGTNGRWQISARSSGGLVLRLYPNTFAALPVFENLIGAVLFKQSYKSRPLLEDLTFAPSRFSIYGSDVEPMRGLAGLISTRPSVEIDALQLIAVRAARNGFFEVAIDESVGLAAKMRQLKHRNPVLSVLAAYAYDLAGRPDQIVDMIRWFLREGQTIPFDLVMLAKLELAEVKALAWEGAPWLRRLLEDEPHRAIAPAWPMLTQGFARLSPYLLDCFPVLAEVRDSLLPGLWTTVVGKAGKKLFEAVRSGAMQWR
jgi:hypothetical protein